MQTLPSFKISKRWLQLKLIFYIALGNCHKESQEEKLQTDLNYWVLQFCNSAGQNGSILGVIASQCVTYMLHSCNLI